MKNLYGLLIALLALFIIWLWATGRVKSVVQDVITPGASTTPGKTPVSTQTPILTSQTMPSFAGFSPVDTSVLQQPTNGLLSQITPSVQPSYAPPNYAQANPGLNLSSMQFTPGQVSFTIPQYISTAPLTLSVPNTAQVGGSGGFQIGGLGNLFQGLFSGLNPKGNVPTAQPDQKGNLPVAQPEPTTSWA